jgi:hypothetical protein
LNVLQEEYEAFLVKFESLKTSLELNGGKEKEEMLKVLQDTVVVDPITLSESGSAYELGLYSVSFEMFVSLARIVGSTPEKLKHVYLFINPNTLLLLFSLLEWG